MNAAVLMLAIVLWVGLMTAVLLQRHRDQRRRDLGRRVIRLHFPRELTADAVVAFVRALTGVNLSRRRPLAGAASVVFEVVATKDRIEHRLHVPANRLSVVSSQLRAAVPGLVIEELDQPPVVDRGAAVELRLTNTDRQLRIDQPVAATTSMLAALQPLVAGETAVVQWVVMPIRPKPITAETTSKSTQPSPLAAILARAPRPTVPPTKEQRDKQAEPLFGAVGRVAVRAAEPRRGRALVGQLLAALRVIERPGVRFNRRLLPKSIVRQRVARASTPLIEFPAQLNAREVATVIAWPIGAPAIPALALQQSRLLAPTYDVPTAGRLLGRVSAPGSTRTVALTAADSLHHLHVVGPTGVGKSTLLANLVIQDVNEGRGVVVVDPKGDLVASVLDRIPTGRAADVIVLDLTDDTRPVGLNLLEQAHEAPERVTDQVVGIFHRLYAAYWGPRTADVLHASLLTLAQVPGMTLCELPILLTNEAFRRRLVGMVDDPVALGPFWSWYEQLSPGESGQAIGPVMNKLRAFLLRRRIRTCIGQVEPTWSVEEVLNQRKVLLVSLAKGELGSEAAALVGSLVIARLWQAIQRRAIRLPAFVVIDEFQDVLNLPTDLGEVLAQARGFGVGLTLAHQHLGQLDSRLRAAVLANARSRVVFQTSADDAGVLARQLGADLAATDLMGLPAHHAYASCCVGGRVAPPASIATESLPPALGSAQTIRTASRERYGRDRVEVEAAIAARHGYDQKPDRDLGRRRRVS